MSKWLFLRAELLPDKKYENCEKFENVANSSDRSKQSKNLTKTQLTSVLGRSSERIPNSFRFSKRAENEDRSTSVATSPGNRFGYNIIGRHYLSGFAENGPRQQQHQQRQPSLREEKQQQEQQLFTTAATASTSFDVIAYASNRRENNEHSSPSGAAPSTAQTFINSRLQQRRRRFGWKTKALIQLNETDEQLNGGWSSSATELISRRGVFARHHYNSVDQLAPTDLDGSDPSFKRFRLENGESLVEKDEVFGSPNTPILENPEHQTRWYFKYFLGKLHQNYVGSDAEKNPYFLSVVSQDIGNQGTPMYRAILFRKQGAQKIVLPYVMNQKLTVKQILTHFSGIDAANSKNPKEIFSADIQKDLLLLEEQEGSVNFKFGVVFMKPGQNCDDEMLSNEQGSKDFQDFLEVLGERIRLKGWDRFRGGLDVKGDMTGKYSVYTLYEGHEIMFHVSTLLPFSRDNRQQVERKRHIGNDIVNIVFVEQNSTDDGKQLMKVVPSQFDPCWIKSQFTHIFAVVTKNVQSYRLAIFCDENVPPFGPTLPNPPEFTDVGMFREFLLVKLINAEKATFQTPIFAQKRERTLEMLIKDLHEDYVSESKSNMLNRRAFSEVLYDVPRASRLKEDARQIEFVRIGQALKLEAIVRGDAPTSIASASPCSIFKKPPWEPHCFYPTFPHRGILVGDSFGRNDECLLIATDDGTFLVREDESYQLVLDKSFSVRQLNVLEDHGLILIRGGSLSNRDSHRIYVFRLREFELPKPTNKTHSSPFKSRGRNEIKDRRIERTRGCHLYASTRSTTGHLRLIVAVGRKLQLFQWKHTAAWSSWCPDNDTETAEGFIFQKEINLNDTPSLLTPLEGPTNTKTGSFICVGFRYHYETICDQTGSSTRLYEVEPNKRNQTQLTAAIELCDGLETELLLCYSHTCHFQKLNDKNGSSNDFDFHWNTSPTTVVCAFPYILGFTTDSIEIRLLVNGNLVYTTTMPELQLITSKRDIFFVTTAPEFISKDMQIKGLQSNDTTRERCLATTPSESTLADENPGDKHFICELQIPTEKHRELTINPDHELTNLLEIPNAAGFTPPIQRARSLQKTHHVKDEKPIIAKSNSCGDREVNTEVKMSRLRDGQRQAQLSVPPNSPRYINLKVSAKNILHQHEQQQQQQQTGSLNSLLLSPMMRNPKQRNIFSVISGINISDAATDTHNNSSDQLKPLRVYRIPLAKLTGTHSHFHMISYGAVSSTGISSGYHLKTSTASNLTKKQQSLDVKFPLCRPNAVLQE